MVFFAWSCVPVYFYWGSRIFPLSVFVWRKVLPGALGYLRQLWNKALSNGFKKELMNHRPKIIGIAEHQPNTISCVLWLRRCFDFNVATETNKFQKKSQDQWTIANNKNPMNPKVLVLQSKSSRRIQLVHTLSRESESSRLSLQILWSLHHRLRRFLLSEISQVP